jgi:hypothetical protein
MYTSQQGGCFVPYGGVSAPYAEAKGATAHTTKTKHLSLPSVGFY